MVIITQYEYKVDKIHITIVETYHIFMSHNSDNAYDFDELVKHILLYNKNYKFG